MSGVNILKNIYLFTVPEYGAEFLSSSDPGTVSSEKKCVYIKSMPNIIL